MSVCRIGVGPSVAPRGPLAIGSPGPRPLHSAFVPSYDVVITGGRVIDPETGLDAVCDVGVSAGRIAEVRPAGDTTGSAAPGERREDPLSGSVEVDARGMVVCPGFIDLHSHAQSLPGQRLQACDGVTTALELEGGRSPIALAYEQAARRGSPINYGFSASWAATRMKVLAGVEPGGAFGSVIGNLGNPEWQREATAEELSRILAGLEDDLAAGGVGIGLLMGYAPGVDPEEYLAVAGLAADTGVPTFTHCRDLVEFSPTTRIDGTEEIVRAAGETGAHMHHCHINSTSGRHIDRVLALVQRCRAEGGRLTTESYPYGSGATGIGAAFLAPDRLAERGLRPSSLVYLATGERVADADRLRQLRTEDPGGAVIVELLDEANPRDAELLRRSLLFEDNIVASDAMPPLPGSDPSDAAAWPLRGWSTHPRTAGTFSRSLRIWREEGLPLSDAIRRCTLLPAQVLGPSVPAMRAKGRVQVGADADLLVFDPGQITDQATYTECLRTSTGISHVMVAGTFVVKDGDLVTEATPGRPLRAEPA